jgi:nucleotide-binding universal stress UspA family protein
MVDHLVRFAPCPTMLLQAEQIADDWQPRKIMVPTNGSVEARRAAEVGFALASNDNGEVHILQVVPESNSVRDVLGSRQIAIAHQIVDELRSMGDTLSVPTVAEVRIGNSPPLVILDAAQHEQIDLIILGIDVRTGNRLYLGPLVEYVLQHAHCPVLVVNAAFASGSSVVVVPTEERRPSAGASDEGQGVPAPAASN